MALKDHITAGFLVLAQSLPAFAQDDNSVYSVSRDCAAQSLRDTFSTSAEITTGEQGVGVSFSTEKLSLSSMVVIDPQTGFVQSIDVQMYTVDPNAPVIEGNAKITYVAGQDGRALSANAPGEFLSDMAVTLTQDIDTKMRECAAEMRFANTRAPLPATLG